MILKIISTVILVFYTMLMLLASGMNVEQGNRKEFWIGIIAASTFAFIILTLWVV